MCNFRIFYISICILALSQLSFQWPISKSRVTSTFCESRGDHFHDGIDIVGENEIIHPVKEGKLVYQWDKVFFPFDSYPGGGNYKVIKNGDILSIYMHLQDGAPYRRSYSTADEVGKVGNSGHSYAEHLHLSFLNLQQKKSINPFLYLPEYTDNMAPQIYDMFFHIEDTYHMIKNNAKIRLTQHYPLLVKIVDVVNGDERLGIYKLIVHFNGKLVENHIFRDLNFSPDGLKSKGKSFDDLFDEAGYYKVKGITYKEGENRFTVIAEDKAGNSTKKEFILNVNLDMN